MQLWCGEIVSLLAKTYNGELFVQSWYGETLEGKGGANPPGEPLRLAGTAHPTNWASGAEGSVDAAFSRQGGGTPPQGRRKR